MSNQNPNAKNPVKAARKSLQIVQAVKRLNGAGVTELANELDINKSSIHNYLSTLEEDGYIRKEESKYYVGLRFFEIGAYTRHQRNIYRVGQPYVRDLAESTGERANLMVEEHGLGVYLCKETGSEAVSVDKHVGSRVYLHNTALGKAILAHLPRNRVETIIDRHGLPRSTPNTIVNRKELFEQFSEIRERGIAYDDEERLKGLRCIAVPISNDDDELCGAISISGPKSRLKGDRLQNELPEKLNSISNIIELNISHSD